MKTRNVQSAVPLQALAAMSEKEWLAHCSPQDTDGADVERAELKGAKARELLASAECNPDPALVAAWSADFGGPHDR